MVVNRGQEGKQQQLFLFCSEQRQDDDTDKTSKKIKDQE